MGRVKKDVSPLHQDTHLDGGVLDANRAQHGEHMQVVLAQFGDGLPYDQERLIHETQFYMQQSATAMLEAGRRLVVLKEATPHGDFQAIVESRLGIHERAARRMMQAAVKFSGPVLAKRSTSTALIEAAGSKSKLFELMTLEDDDLAELAEGGTVANLNLDDIARKSVTELREMVREHRENYKAQAEVLADKNNKIDKLQAEVRKAKRRVAETPVDEIGPELLQEVSRYAFAAETSIRGDFRAGVEAMIQHADMEGTDPRISVAGFLLQIERALNEIYSDYDIPRELASTATPELVG